MRLIYLFWRFLGVRRDARKAAIDNGWEKLGRQPPPRFAWPGRLI